ncbi:MAG: polyprenyl diphosphate synthase [Rhodocyclaceae bacterium]|nr:polyprenyl diphosphate synthase [Rhodocyclaceae bacterium]
MAIQPSSTRAIPEVRPVPRHVAIIMDGNGRWAKTRKLPRAAGHREGVEAVRRVVRASIERGVEYVTLFAFSSENWRRPAEEVSFLMGLFVAALEREVDKLHANGVRLKVIGDVSAFDTRLVDLIRQAEQKTAGNQRLTLTIAANYGGRWDLMQAINAMTLAHPEKRGCYRETDLEPFLALGDIPEPDLFIRTGGEQRISNFLLWHLAYTELYFTDKFWPDFDEHLLDEAIASYRRRERRFGRTSEQLHAAMAQTSFPSAAASEALHA